MADPAPPNPTEAAPTSRKRGWFQIHLSTCVVLMFVAGALIWANTESYVIISKLPRLEEEPQLHSVTAKRGWPFPYVSQHLLDSTGISDTAQERNACLGYLAAVGWRSEEISAMGVLYDSLVAMIALAVVALSSERLLRRWERRHERRAEETPRSGDSKIDGGGSPR